MRKTAVICFALLLASVYIKVNAQSRTYEVWDNLPAKNSGPVFNPKAKFRNPVDNDWEAESYPLGNGYMGANVFGRTDIERIQLTEKTLYNSGPYGFGGITNFAEVYLDFNHNNPTAYKRTLNLNEAIHYVNYKCDGIEYTREYFMSYPDKVLAIKIGANQPGKISFTIKPQIPYLSEKRRGAIVAQNDLIRLYGSLQPYSINYEAQIKVVNEGGAVSSNAAGEIIVQNASSVVLFIATGTNYELSNEVFLENTESQKTDASKMPQQKVSEVIKNAVNKGYNALRSFHLQDYQELFSRVELNLTQSVPQIPTKALLENYKIDGKQIYLEELMYHFARYLIISSSREGTLPAGLQGTWSHYDRTPWTGGYWHNINVQMNYWGVFNSNLSETFLPYIEYFQAYFPKAQQVATNYLKKNYPNAVSINPNENGWAIGTAGNPYYIEEPGGHSGPGTGGFTSKLFWEYYEFTRDTSFLKEVGYPCILEMSKFLSKTLVPSGNNLLLVNHSASPEQKHNGEYYMTKGCTFDQGFVWENHNDLLKAADILGEKNDFLLSVKDQIKKLDPILIGTSGQIKEFREEKAYGEIGEYHHRHISHLCPLYPGTLINSNTPEWISAASKTLGFRGNNTTGWALAHRMNCRARTKEAEKAREAYSKFIKDRTLPNLWTVHPPFQIDGSLGTMAGVAEMLLQSHEGCIEPLPAVPYKWKKGSFKGLMARGNFEVSAKWDNETVQLVILSKNGGKCTVKYPGIESIKIEDQDGKSIKITIDDENMISFSTLRNKKYYMKLDQVKIQIPAISK
ncbi:MAG: glycoside hydrolase family 95 protein [Bacteroidota bacterium]